MALLPLLVGHAVDSVPALLLGQGQARASAASFSQFDRQLRQKPARFMRSMFCTSVRSRRCSTRRRKAAASSSVRVAASMSFMAGSCQWLAQALAGPRALEGVGTRRSAARRQGLEQPGEALRPFLRASPGGDQVLPDLDQGVGEAAPGGVAVDRVARERAIIGLVVADHEAVLRPRPSRSGRAKRSSASHRMPTCQGRGQPRQIGVKLWIVTMAGGQPAARARVDRGRDRGIVGIVEALDPPLDLGLVRPRVAGHHRAVGEAHHEGRVVPAPVGVDDEPGEPREDRRSPEAPRERARDVGGADVVGDVALETRLSGSPRSPKSGGTAFEAWSHRISRPDSTRAPGRISTGWGSKAGVVRA